MPRGARPGENRFAAKQEKHIRKTVAEIDAVLSLLRPRRVRFDNITQLSNYLADVINERRRAIAGDSAASINASTLRRQPRYRVKLDSFLASPETDYAKEFEKLQTGLESIELQSLRAENARLKAYIDKSLIPAQGTMTPQPAFTNHPNVVDDLCRIIALLLEASDGQFVLDASTGEIVRAWAASKKNRMVVPSSLAKQFVEWSKSMPAST